MFRRDETYHWGWFVLVRWAGLVTLGMIPALVSLRFEGWNQIINYRSGFYYLLTFHFPIWQP